MLTSKSAVKQISAETLAEGTSGIEQSIMAEKGIAKEECSEFTWRRSLLRGRREKRSA